MAQLGIIVKLGSVINRWERNKRQVIKNRDLLSSGNKVESEDFDIFDQWLSRQRKFIREYVGTEDHEELRSLRRFLKQETDVPEVHLHFAIWSSLCRTDNKVILERMSRLVNEYHQSRVAVLCPDHTWPVQQYQDSLVKELNIIRQIEKARENYRVNLAAVEKFKARRDLVWDEECEPYHQRKLLHEAKVTRKTYEDILRFETGKVRAALMKTMHELERLVILEEEKRLTQLLAIVAEYFTLLVHCAELDIPRKDSVRHYIKEIRHLESKIPQIVRTWIQNQRTAVQFPEFQDSTREIKANNTGHVVRTIREEIRALETRFWTIAVKEEEVICLSPSNDSLDDDIPQEVVSKEVFFKASPEFYAKKSTEASDLCVVDLDGKESNHVLYPTVTSSSRAFTIANQQSRRSISSTHRMNSFSSMESPHIEVVPGSIVSEDDVVNSPAKTARLITLSSSEDEISECDHLSTSQADEVVPFTLKRKEKKVRFISKIGDISVHMKNAHLTSVPNETHAFSGIPRKERVSHENRRPYGQLRR